MKRILSVVVLTLFTSAVEARAQSPADSADAAWKSGNTALAQRLYDAILATDSTDGTALHRVALMHAWAERYDASLRLFERLLRTYPQNSEARLDRARVLAWSGRTDAALMVADSMMAASPRNADARGLRAQLLAWQGRLVEAELLWRELAAESPESAAAFLGLAQALRWQGRDASALDVLQRAAALAPDNADAQEQLSSIRTAMSPRAAPALTYESDSDDNSILSTTITAATFVQPRVEVRADGYNRNATGAIDGLSARAYGASAGIRLQLEPGWWISGAIGASASNADDADAFPALRAAVTTPGRHRASGTISVSRTALDGTSALIERQVYTDEIGVDAQTTIRNLQLSASAGSTRFHSRVSGGDNQRWHTNAAVTRALNRTVTIGARGRAFGFEHDLNDGYFDPDFYGLIELTGRVTRESQHVMFTVEGAPGIQQVRSGEPATGSYRVNARSAYTFSPGRSIGIHATFARSGLQQLSSTAGSDYTYRALGISAGWTF